MGRIRRLLPPSAPLARRRFLQLGVGAVGVAASGCGGDKPDGGAADSGLPDPAGSCGPDVPTAAGDASGAREGPFERDPFGLGVASGDPMSDRVVLWTRLVVEPTDAAATPTETVDVVWEVASGEDFASVLQTGLVQTDASVGHSVHVDVDGLEPETEYFYRFRVGEFHSPVGRTRTLPCRDARPSSLRIGFTTCQNFMSGWYVVQRDMASQKLDLVIGLGDYIYESGRSGSVRDHGADEPVDLEGYRNRYGLYKSDADLQAMHASAPYLPIWDDHEVDNNHAGESGRAQGASSWAARRAAAYRAWWEHMPVRGPAPTADALAIHRELRVGDLAQIILLDGRQHRDPQPCGDRIGSRCPETDDDRTLLGLEQEAWLEERLRAGATRWVLLANPVVMLPMDFGGVFLNPDQWDGYPQARQRLMDAVAASALGETVVFTGDIHASGVGYVPVDPFDPTTPPAISEFIVPAATSGVSDESIAAVGGILGAQPHISWWDFVEKGWVLAELERDRLVARYRLAEDVTDPASAVVERRAWTVDAGSPGPVEQL
ncbi:MAG: alkaline phosphatase D family protein [Myxococcota bacterium]|nr:alkaline phosphatase D family protein [Myxococcota bacterium]